MLHLIGALILVVLTIVVAWAALAIVLGVVWSSRGFQVFAYLWFKWLSIIGCAIYALLAVVITARWMLHPWWFTAG